MKTKQHKSTTTVDAAKNKKKDTPPVTSPPRRSVKLMRTSAECRRKSPPKPPGAPMRVSMKVVRKLSATSGSVHVADDSSDAEEH
jgi:hypothetical protein